MKKKSAKGILTHGRFRKPVKKKGKQFILMIQPIGGEPVNFFKLPLESQTKLRNEIPSVDKAFRELKRK